MDYKDTKNIWYTQGKNKINYVDKYIWIYGIDYVSLWIMNRYKADILTYLNNHGAFISKLNGMKVCMDSLNSSINYNQLERCFRSGYYSIVEWERLCDEWADMESETARKVSAVICKWISSDRKYGKQEYR